MLDKIPGFPKIYAIGSHENHGLLDGPVEITEKLDGSSIAFGNIDKQLFIRSKSKLLDLLTPDKMFQLGVDKIKELDEKGLLLPNAIYYGEYFNKNKHNAISYDHVPKGNIALFAISHYGAFLPRVNLTMEAAALGFDTVPQLFVGNYPVQKNGENSLIAELMNKESYLGKVKPEGIVFKRYDLTRDEKVSNTSGIIVGKCVSEEFKEVSHGKSKMYKKEVNSKLDAYLSQFCTRARWDKAIQHLRDSGELATSSRDIPNLLRELNKDLEAEEKENIKEKLWQIFGKEVYKIAGSGFAEYYLNHLRESA